jgi:predicted GH43/DUF377 family glycosyl hydrolase
MSLPLRRLNVFLKADPTRVLVRPFLPAVEPRAINPTDAPRALKIITRILSLSDAEVESLLAEVMAEFGDRHQAIRCIFLDRFAQVEVYLPTDRPLSESRRLLIGSYFTNEYSLECAALFNPSIVPHPDQGGVAPGDLRVILSLRATGEGHVSSITFRSGFVTAAGDLHIDPPSRFVAEPQYFPNTEYRRDLFQRKLAEMGLENEFSAHVLDALAERFTLEQLQAAVDVQTRYRPAAADTGRRMVLLARSNYEFAFAPEQPISERVVFPFSPSQSNGIEDARFVHFVEDDGTACYYATYTAYDGRVILPQLLETRDFQHFRICTLNGPAVQNKGMALFPRRVRGQYCMLSRQDNENIRVMFSDDLHFWFDSRVIVRPTEPWEFVQMGNCGSPIETEAGWLVLTHGVGAMRKYCIGAILLDRDDPTRVLARLREPLIKPEANEREGYVPNVVYTCGALLHNGMLVVPYAISDSATTVATVPMADLLAAMTRV